jgi:hypothetical protein
MFEKPPSKEDIDRAVQERGLVKPEDVENRKRELVELIVAQSTELSESKESLPFTGLDPIAYENLKREEATYPEYVVTPIDELISRFKAEGMRVVLPRQPGEGNATVVPWGSTDYDSDSVLFRHLQVYGMVDVRLKALIEALQEYKKLNETK